MAEKKVKTITIHVQGLDSLHRETPGERSEESINDALTGVGCAIRGFIVFFVLVVVIQLLSSLFAGATGFLFSSWGAILFWLPAGLLLGIDAIASAIK